MATTSDLRALIETVEALQSQERKHKLRINTLEQQLITKEAEIESLRVLPRENSLIREENNQLRDRIRELEQSTTRMVEQSSIGAESSTQVTVKLQAFQRHNNYLQGELATKDSKIRAMQERVDILTEELHSRDRRCGILVEKLRQHSIDPSTVSATNIQVPEEVYSQMKQKLAQQSTNMELLQERVEGLQEEAQRRELLIEALQRENGALRQSVSRLIAQVNGTSLSYAQQQHSSGALTMGGGSPSDMDSKLRAYRSSKGLREGSPLAAA